MSRILIIEDDRAIAEIERDYLELSGYEVDIVSDGREGLETARNGSYDLILLDLMLPGMDGFTVCRKLRETLDIPVLMVTARQEDVDKIRGLGMGADDYIEKPFSPSVLVARVKAHLQRYERLTGGRRTPSAIEIGDIRVETASRRVYVKGREVDLKNREYDLLLFLMVNMDKVFDKETLYEKVWGMDAMGDNATVAVHINRIREKIEPDPSKPQYIQTVWGAGYRFSGKIRPEKKEGDNGKES
jgi:DNA-binding response OmpR family regulator